MARQFRSYKFEEPTESKAISSAEMKMPGPETVNGIVMNSLFVNARKDPTPNAPVVEVLRRGDRVTILSGLLDGFYKVLLPNGRIAYISSFFIREER